MYNSKKAQESASYIMFVIAIFLSVGIFVIVILSTNLIKERIKAEFKEDISNIDYDLLFLDILRTPIQDKTIADLIVEAYTNNNYVEVETQLNNILENYIHSNIDWKLYIDDKEVKNNCGILCNGKKQSYEVVLPLFDTKKRTYIKVTFALYLSKSKPTEN